MKNVIVGALVVVLAGALVWVLSRGDMESGGGESFPLYEEEPYASCVAEASKGAPCSSLESEEDSDSPLLEDDDEDEEAEEEPQTEEEKREAEEEKLVEAFDALTDRWEEESKKGVSMDDIAAFAKAFKALPKDRQDECIHRALNLIPDENVMLLAGVLMDKSVDKEIVEEVFNDVLNRDEDVKEPILREIFKDKTHPCWADTAWILDVTDGLPRE